MRKAVAAVLLVLGASLCSCGCVPQSQMDECQVAQSELTRTVADQRKQIAELMQMASVNESHLLILENERQRVAAELRGFEVTQGQGAAAVRAYVRVGFAPVSPKCDIGYVAWTMVLSETHTVGVTFTEMVDWHRTMEGPFGTGYSTRLYHDVTTDPQLLPVRVEAGGRVDLDLGGHECVSEKRQYFYVLFGADDNGNEVVATGALVVDPWESSE